MSLRATLGSRRSIAWRPVTYNKVSQRIEISATTNEAVAQALENAKDLPEGGLKRHGRGISAPAD
jgi:hypothetical protein